MKTTVTQFDFIDAFKKADREDNFSRAGLLALLKYFEGLEEDSGIEVELDVVGICCEYTEADWSEIASNYGIDIEYFDDDEIEITVRSYLEDRTVLVGLVPGGCVYLNF